MAAFNLIKTDSHQIQGPFLGKSGLPIPFAALLDKEVLADNFKDINIILSPSSCQGPLYIVFDETYLIRSSDRMPRGLCPVASVGIVGGIFSLEQDKDMSFKRITQGKCLLDGSEPLPKECTKENLASRALDFLVKRHDSLAPPGSPGPFWCPPGTPGRPSKPASQPASQVPSQPASQTASKQARASK
jgi:hypothetical protein